MARVDTPTVSVVLSVHDDEPFLAECLESVLAQTGVSFEVIAIDDGSTDGSAVLLDAYAARDARLRVVHQPNAGLTRALIRGCAMARGRFVARQGAFDVLLVSQPYGYRLGQWVRAERRRGRRTPVYLHRSHGHELVAAAQMAALHDQLPHDARPAWRHWSTRALARRLAWQAREALRVADGTIVPSEFDRDFLLRREGADAARVRTIHHAPLDQYLAAPLAPYTPDRHRRVLYVGNVTNVKGASVLPTAVGEAFDRFADARLTVVAPASDHTSQPSPAKLVPTSCGPYRLVREVVPQETRFRVARAVDSTTVVVRA
jgi:glycosyltransferase involved in cell wall biosynthesis